MKKWFAMLDTGEWVPLGEHETFCIAADVEPSNTHWLIDEEGLRKMRDSINQVLGDQE